MYRQLYDRLRAQILSGQLEAGTRLSSTRNLAAELGVSRTTTALVYEQLLLEGYVESRVGDGTRVARLHLERRDHGAGGEHRQDAHPPRPSQRGQVLTRTRFPELAYADLGSGLTNLFRVGEPDVAHFPWRTWARMLARHARLSLRAVPYYQAVRGHPPLREAIAAHIGVTPRYIHMLFEPEGMSFTQFVLGERLAAAHGMLNAPRHASDTITSIAYAVGFADLSHFNRSFRRRYGCTPSDVRMASRGHRGGST